jgi:hypothetical protein
MGKRAELSLPSDTDSKDKRAELSLPSDTDSKDKRAERKITLKVSSTIKIMVLLMRTCSSVGFLILMPSLVSRSWCNCCIYPGHIWYLVLGGIAVGRGFEPQSDLELSFTQILIYINITSFRTEILKDNYHKTHRLG